MVIDPDTELLKQAIIDLCDNVKSLTKRLHSVELDLKSPPMRGSINGPGDADISPSPRQYSY